MSNTNKVFMAFSKGAESTDYTRKLYVGVGTVSVLGVNPDKDTLEKIYKAQLEKEPEYIKEMDSNGTQVKTARVEIVIQTDAQLCDGIDTITRIPFFLRKEYRTNRDKTKIQVIDKYGRTAWVTMEQAKNHEIPMYKNGPANLDKDYRPCYVGEEDLTSFIKTYLRIPNAMKYVNGNWIPADNLEDCEARLDNIENYFKGDFTEMKSVIALQPKNKVKAMFGVKSSNDGKQFQTIYTHYFLGASVSDYSKLDADLQERLNSGAYQNVEFSTMPIHEYKVEATDFSENTESNLAESNPWD